jgi:WD40 repeat protein
LIVLKVQVQKVHTLTGHRDSVYTLQGSSDSRFFFSGSGDGMVVIWDLADPEHGQVIAQLPNSIYALHYHVDSNVLIAGHNYDGIHILDWKNKKELGSLQLSAAAVFDIQSYGRDLFVATGDGMLLKIDTMNLTITGQTQRSSKSARTIAISGSRGEVAVGYSDNFIRIFEMDTLKLKYEWHAHNNSVFTVRYTPDQNRLLSGSRDARLKAWDTGNNYTQAGEVVAHLYAINHLDFSPDGKHFVTCSMDKSIKVWDTEKLKLLKVIDKARHAGHGTSVNKVLWTSYNDQLLSASDDRTISVWTIDFE